MNVKIICYDDGLDAFTADIRNAIWLRPSRRRVLQLRCCWKHAALCRELCELPCGSFCNALCLMRNVQFAMLERTGLRVSSCCL